MTYVSLFSLYGSLKNVLQELVVCFDHGLQQGCFVNGLSKVFPFGFYNIWQHIKLYLPYAVYHFCHQVIGPLQCIPYFWKWTVFISWFVVQFVGYYSNCFYCANYGMSLPNTLITLPLFYLGLCGMKFLSVDLIPSTSVTAQNLFFLDATRTQT